MESKRSRDPDSPIVDYSRSSCSKMKRKKESECVSSPFTDPQREQIQVILDKARCYAYDQFQKNHPFDLLRLSDMRSLLRLVSTGDRIVYSRYNQFMESEDAESVRDMLPSQLFYQLPLYVEGDDCFVLCADAECYLREFYYMNSMIPLLLYYSPVRFTVVASPRAVSTCSPKGS